MIMIPLFIILAIKKTSIVQNYSSHENIIGGIVIVIFTFIFTKILQGNLLYIYISITVLIQLFFV